MPKHAGRWLSTLALITIATSARADLLDEVEKQLAPEKARRQAAEAQATKGVEAEQQKALREVERADQKVKEAQARLDRVAEEQRKAAARVETQSAERTKRKQRADALAGEVKQKREAAASVTQAARALEAAASMVAAGNGDVADKLAAARGDAGLARAAQAVDGMAAFLKSDDKRVLADLTPEVVQAFPSALRYRGLARLRQGDRDGAWKDLRAAPLAPGDLPAQAALAELAAAHSDEETARAGYARLFAADPTSEPAAMGLARALLALHRAADAMAPLIALAGDGKHREASYLLAQVSVAAGDRARAESALAAMLAVPAARVTADPSFAKVKRPLRVLVVAPVWIALPDPLDDEAARTQLAAWQLDDGDAPAALRLLADAKSAAALYVRGLAHRRAGDRAKAKADLERAAKLDATQAAPRQALAVVTLEAGDADAARAIAAAVEKNPAARLTEGVALGELGKRAEAETLLGGLRAAPAAVADAAATDLAALRRAAGDREGAWKASPERPLTPEGWLLRGLLLADRGDAKAAAVALRAATVAAPAFVDAWLALAHALETAGDHAGAKEAARRALEISPDLVEARTILGRLYGKEGDGARQAAELARIRELGEEVSGAAGKRHVVGVIAFDNNSGDPSLEWLRQGVAEALVTDLGRLGALTIIERTQVQKAFTELKFQELGFTDPSTAAKVGKLLGADALLLGQVARSGGGLRLDGRVIEVGSGKVLKTATAEGSLEHVFDVERRLALELVGDYAAVTGRERAELFAAGAPSLASLEHMAQVRMLTSQGKSREAKAAYQRLLAEDPKAAAQLAALQKDWSNVAATVAVVPLTNVSGRPDEAWMGVGIAEALGTDLKKLGLFLVERQQIEKLMQERRFTEIFNDADAVKLGKLAGASVLLLGSYQVQNEALRIDARLVDVATGQVLATYGADGNKAALFEVEARLLKQVAAGLEVDATKVDERALANGKPSLEDFKRYIQASSKVVVKPAAPTQVTVQSLAVGPWKTSRGEADARSPERMRDALRRHGRAPVSLAATAEPRLANADALVLGSVSELGGKVRVDARAVLAATGEVVASASSLGAAAELDATEDQVARNLLAGLELNGDHADSDGKRTDRTPLYKKWWLWTAVGIVVAGGVVAGVVAGTQQQSIPRADLTLTAR